MTATLTRLLNDVLTSRVYDVARETPLDRAAALSQRLGNDVLFKREDLQPVFSFKLRGAYNRIAHLTDAERSRGIIAASAGNHAQGVAYSARKLGLPAIIVMPQTTPAIKVEAVRGMGAEVVLVGDNYSEAKIRCDELVTTTGRILIHPFDDPLVIAGQGTIGAEIVRHAQDRLTAVFVPVGGGGLIAGIAGYIKALRPEVRIIGVEPFESDAMYRSLAAGTRVRLDHVGIFADGVAVREVGELTFAIAQETVDEVVRVTNDQICGAIKDIFDDTRTVMEPAGALAVAGLKTWVEREGARDKSLVALLSGANMNFDRLRFVAERAEVGEAREALLAVTIPERPGAFREFCAALGRRVVTEFNYRLSGRRQAHIFVGVATQSRQDGSALAAKLNASGYETVDLSGNEIAKLHVRHMVGGHAPCVQNERLCRFEFPERPGAFREFCAAIGRRVVTEFNYRLSGRDIAHIFVGIGTRSRADAHALVAHLRQLGYETADLSGNEIAKLHVRHMVGGHAPCVQNERLCRFEFPERPGALMDFLDTLGGRWNISLFHYRNHGSDFGRVLAGFEVPDADLASFAEFLERIGYRYSVEKDNEAYHRFLA